MATPNLSDVLSALSDLGIEFTAKQMAAIEEAKKSAALAPALSVFIGNGENLPGKLIEKNEENGMMWVERSFDLAADLVSSFEGDVKKVQGGATRTVRMFGIDTPNGHLKVELRSE